MARRDPDAGLEDQGAPGLCRYRPTVRRQVGQHERQGGAQLIGQGVEPSPGRSRPARRAAPEPGSTARPGRTSRRGRTSPAPPARSREQSRLASPGAAARPGPRGPRRPEPSRTSRITATSWRRPTKRSGPNVGGRRWPTRGGRRSRVRSQQLGLQVDRRRGRVEAELLAQQPPVCVVAGQRRRPVPGRRQGPDQGQHCDLPQRLGPGRRGGPLHGEGRVARGQRKVGGALPGRLPGLDDFVPERLGPAGVTVLCQRLDRAGGQRAPVDRERRPLAECVRPAQLGEEHLGVYDAPGRVGQRVPGGPGDHEVRPTHRPAYPVDQHLQVGRRIGRGAIRPEPVGQDVEGDQPAALDGQHPQQGSHLPAAEGGGRHLGAVPDHDEAAEEPQLDHRSGRGFAGHLLIMANR